MSLDPIYVEWIRELDEEILMTSPYLLTRQYLMRIKSGEIYPYNLDQFVDPKMIEHWRRCRIDRLRDEEDRFHLSSCAIADVERVEFIKALPAHFEKMEEQAVIDSFPLIADSTGSSSDSDSEEN
jgi:hypothetical protein